MSKSIENLSKDSDVVVTLSNVIAQLRRSDIGTAITAVYAVVDPDAIELSAVAGDDVEIVPLATGVNYLVVAVGEIGDNAGIYFPEREVNGA